MVDLNLKNCPMCDGKARHVTISFVRHQVKCSRCTLTVTAFLKQAASDAWNRRSSPAAEIADPVSYHEHFLRTYPSRRQNR
jgi:hypothetical protein